MSAIVYRAATTADAPALSAMAAVSFAETFGAVIAPADLTAYLAQAYGPDGAMTRDLADPTVAWQAAFADAVPIGYLKLSPLVLPYAAAAAGAMEVRQLYVAESAKGTGVAATLMAWAIAHARAAAAPELFLAVFDHNARATRFYARHGFEKVAAFPFVIGSVAHEDGIWRLRL